MEQQAVIDFFDQAAAGWDAQLVRNEAVIGQILDNAGIRPGVSVLDVACGTGVLIPDYLKRGAAQSRPLTLHRKWCASRAKNSRRRT